MLSVSCRARWPWTLLTIVNIHDSLERASPGAETPAEFWVALPTLLLSPRLPPVLCPSSLCSPPQGQLSQGYILRRHMTEAQSFTLVWRQGPQLWAPTPDLQVEAESWLFGGNSQSPFFGHHSTAGHMKSLPTALFHLLTFNSFPSPLNAKIPLCYRALAYAVPSACNAVPSAASSWG